MAGSMRRYTDVMSLLDILRHKHLRLKQPTTWYDQNDALGLREYGRLMSGGGEGTVYALCFADGPERAHHWQIFAGHTHGVCIVFDREKFIKHVTSIGSFVLSGPVQYKSLTEIRAMRPIPLEDLPFLKRDTFKAEAEYRLVAWDGTRFAGDTFDIAMPLDIIDRVVLGPAVPPDLGQTLRDVACSLPDCDRINFTRSKLVNNASWAQAIAEGVKV